MGDGVIRRGRGGDDAEEYGPGHQADLGRKDCGRVCSHSKGTPHLNTCRYTLKIFAYRKDICRERRFYLHFANNLYYLFCRLSVLQIFKIYSNGCTLLGAGIFKLESRRFLLHDSVHGFQIHSVYEGKSVFIDWKSGVQFNGHFCKSGAEPGPSHVYSSETCLNL